MMLSDFLTVLVLSALFVGVEYVVRHYFRKHRKHK